MMKKVLVQLLMVAMLLSLVPLGAVGSMSASAATSGDFTYTVLADGTAKITGYDGAETELVIPSVLDEYAVTVIGYNAFYKDASIEHLVIPDGLTTIEKNAFDGCASLVSVSIADSVTSIGTRAFADCTSLAALTVPDNITSFGSNVFKNTAYTNDTDNWTDGALYIGKYLVKVDTNLQGTYTIRTGTEVIAGKAFYDCDGLTEIVFPKGLKIIGESAFENCSFIKNMVIPDGVTTIEKKAFALCTSLLWLIIPDSVTYIADTAFYKSYSIGIYAYVGSYAQQFAQSNGIFCYATPKPSKVGDIDGDGDVNVSDVLVALEYIAQYEITGDIILLTDLTGDGRVNLQDVVRLFYIANGLIEQ